MNDKIKKISITFSRKLKTPLSIVTVSLLGGLIFYSILHLIFPYTSFYSGLIFVIVIAPLIAYPLGKVLTTYSRELNRLYKKSKNDNETKARSLSILSHDIRSPLTNIKQMVQLIGGGNMTPTESKKHLNKLEHDLEQTLILTNNLIKWIKAQDDDIETNYSEFSAQEIITETIILYKSISDNKNISVLTDTNSSVTINSDKEMCKIVLRNLLSNAIKFSIEGGTINLGFSKEENSISFWVKDYGVGMDSQKKTTIFQKDFEKSDLGTAQEKGTGIGLNLSKKIIEKLEGKIWVESELNQGACFYFSLPLNS